MSHGLVMCGLGMRLLRVCGLGMRLLMDVWFGNEATDGCVVWE